MAKVYLDNAATTKIHPQVAEKMFPYLNESFGNPSSTHSFGRKIRVAIEDARDIIANIIGADSSEVYFTSGGTEANNFLVSGIAKTELKESGRNTIITSPTEHKAILDTVTVLSDEGFKIDFLESQSDSTVNISSLKNKLDTETSLVSAMVVNNETGAINNIEKISSLVKGNKSYLHVDAVQAFGKLPINVEDLQIDALSGSAHKIGGPKGIGFAYVRNGTPMSPIIFGGGQERNRRGGTENVIGIIGLTEAAKIASQNMAQNFEYVTKLKKQLKDGITLLDNKGITFFDGDNFSPYILNMILSPEFYNNDPEAILMFMDINGVAVSSGSACTSGTWKPSHVITASGRKADEAKGALRFSFSPDTTKDDISYGLEIFEKLLAQVSLN